MINQTTLILYTRYKLIIDAGIYGIAGVFITSIPIILLPLLTRNLSQTEYGYAMYFSSFVNILIPLIGFGVSNAISVKFFKIEEAKFRTYLWSCTFIIPVSGAFILLSYFTIAFFFPDIKVLTDYWMIILVLTAVLWGVTQAFGVLLIAMRQPFVFLFLNASIGTVTIILTLIFIFELNLGWSGFCYALLLGHLFGGALSLYIQRKYFSMSKPDLSFIKDSLKFGFPLMLHSISMMLIAYVDRLIITNVFGVEAFGIYVVAFQFSIILGFAAQAFSKAFIPWLYTHLRQNEYQSKVTALQGLCLSLAVIIISTALLALFIDNIIGLVAGAQFIPEGLSAEFISIGAGFNAAYLMTVGVVLFAERTALLSMVSASVALLSITINIVIIPTFGIPGASFSYLTSNAMLFICVVLLALKSVEFPRSST